MDRGIRLVGTIPGASAVAARSFTRRPYARQELRFNAERPLRKHGPAPNSQLFLSTTGLVAGIHVSDESQFPHPPFLPCQDGTGQKTSARSRPRVGTEAGRRGHHARGLRRIVRLREQQRLRHERAAAACGRDDHEHGVDEHSFGDEHHTDDHSYSSVRTTTRTAVTRTASS